jgi:hypothetical protein
MHVSDSLNVIVLVALSMNTLDQSLRISTWASMGSLGPLGPNDDVDGDHDYDGKSTRSRSTAMPATRQGQPTALKPRQSQSLLLQQQTRDAEAETMTTTRIGTSTTMENFKPEQGLESIPCRTTDVPTVQEHLEYYFGEGGPNSTHNTNQSTSAPSLIFFITPTYKRVTQMADLLRLSYTLDHDRAVYWIVVEDSNTCSKRVPRLTRSIRYTLCTFSNQVTAKNTKTQRTKSTTSQGSRSTQCSIGCSRIAGIGGSVILW